MPITPYLDGQSFDPETIRVMGIAFEMTRVALRIEDRTDPVVEIITKRIIELAKEGERNVDRLCDGALDSVRATPEGLSRFSGSYGRISSHRPYRS
jgi:hypothetical protein